MDEKTLSNVLNEIAEQAVPGSHDPWPVMHERITSDHRQGPRFKEQPMKELSMPAASVSLRKAAVMIVLAIVLVSAVISLTPQGRAWAQQIIGLFTRTEQLSFPLSPEQMQGANQAEQPESPGQARPTIAPPESLVFFDQECANLDGQAGTLCRVGLAEDEAGFAILLPALDDSRLALTSLAVDTAQGIVQAGFGYQGYPGTDNSVWIYQGVQALPVESGWQMVPQQYIQPVSVAGVPAEYVKGSFIARPGASQATWADEIPMARLRWKQGQHWFEIFKAGQPETVTFMDRAGMIRLAESLVQVTAVK